ncbi:helix-turn-helix domain-containing protein [Bradyrhizobium lupini]
MRKVDRADRKRPSNQKNERVDRQLLNDAAGATKVPIDQRIGATIRRVRREQGLTLANVASAADISSSMLSRFETGKSTASLAQLERLCVTFGVDLALFLNAIEQAKREPEFIKASARKEVMRAGTKYGHTFHSLSQIKGSGKDFESFLVNVNRSQRYPRFRHRGTEFIYMLNGTVQYRYEDDRILLQPGDALTIPDNVTHGPEKLFDDNIQFIAIIIHKS